MLVGLGNRLRGDDGFGSLLVERLNGRISAVCVDAGTTPENFIGRIAREKPDTLVLVDAMHLGGKAGDCALMGADEIAAGGLSTHDLSPRVFTEHLRERTSAKMYMLGIQPHDLTLGAPLSEPLQRRLEELTAALEEACRA